MLNSHRAVRIESTVDIINQRYCEALTLEELAFRACYSRWHFLRAFEEETHETPFDFLRKRRLYAAGYRLLSDTLLSMADLSIQTGFQCASSFSKGFRRQFGMTPSEWRAEGWRDWAALQPLQAPPPAGQDTLPNTQQEYDADRVYQIDPRHLQIEIVPEQPVAYKRFRGVWGEALRNTIQSALRIAPLPHPCFLGVRQDLLHLRGPTESCYDVCIPVRPGTQPPGIVSVGRVLGGLYAVFRPQLGDPSLSWRSLLHSWPSQGRFVFDPRRSMVDRYTQHGDILHCDAQYLPIMLRPV
ncbi:helix-turn-helix domain-containing protein [Chitiniphilus eburneus]|uniref:Helix-turn-helix domain-containing protein n=1 Tax=Chitiniphilus eburneus TaxID=2571148 RepID=A0A4U0PXC0_9NEIS|nr:helix-turn-helix domain-containing protein [Chitiniphilus eburneus]TJZ73221.1 helix-turn-helix domain-containing protein [Chitiniphilus eburneus]